MTKLDEIENLLAAVQASPGPKNSPEKEMDFDLIDGCITSYTDYHNEAVNQGCMITMAKFRYDDEKFADFIRTLHEKRKNLHETMIKQTIVLNSICEKYGQPEIYSGNLDQNKGRDDNDTRFGVAEFAERLCHDFFRTTHETLVSEKAKAAYKTHAENIKQNSGSWNTMQRMLEKMNAQAGMDSSSEQADY